VDGAVTENVELDDSVGRISAKNVRVYPPSVPIILEGERISARQADFLKRFGKNLFNVNGGKIETVKEL
jgi:arginine/lysine/ornithine decarboxylase